jgi:hypothetical protein
LARKGDEGRGVAAIRFGEVPSNLRSEDVRMRKLREINSHDLFSNLNKSVPWEVKHFSTKRKINKHAFR